MHHIPKPGGARSPGNERNSMEYVMQLLARLKARIQRRGYSVRRRFHPVEHHVVYWAQKDWDTYLDERERQIRCGRLD